MSVSSLFLLLTHLSLTFLAVQSNKEVCVGNITCQLSQYCNKHNLEQNYMQGTRTTTTSNFHFRSCKFTSPSLRSSNSRYFRADFTYITKKARTQSNPFLNPTRIILWIWLTDWHQKYITINGTYIHLFNIAITFYTYSCVKCQQV